LQTFKLNELDGRLTSASFQVLLEAAKKHALANPPHYMPPRKGRQEFRDFLLQMGSTAYPKQVRLCPVVERVRGRLAGESLIVTVHSYSGYDFSAEYTHVYKGKFSPKTAPDDLDAVLRRALRSASPTIGEGSCARYAEFAARIGAWEGDLASAVCEETLRARFPRWSALPLEIASDSDEPFRHVQIYVGHNGVGELSFSVRVRLSLELAPALAPVKDAPNSDRAAAAAAAALVDVQLEADTTLEAVYYREFSLTDAVIDAFSQGSVLGASGGKMQVPPPPPKRSKVGAEGEDDIRVYLLVGTRLASSAEEAAADGAAEGPEGETPTAAAADLDAAASKESAKETSDKDADATAAAQASFCVELYGWGFDSAHSLGLGPLAGYGRVKKVKDDKEDAGLTDEQKIEQALALAGEMVHGPRRIPLDRVIAIERVKMLACSSNHTLLLTCMGSLFACGDNTEGALGTGDFAARSIMTPVDWFNSMGNAGAGAGRGAVKIAAGSSSIGSHSMAIDRSGKLYGWGVAYAVGVGVVKAIPTPTRVMVGELNAAQQLNPEAEEPVAGAEAGGAGVASAAAEAAREVVDVACGGGFTVCVTRAGHAYSWGIWAHGRLGLGPVPVQEAIRGPYRRGGKKSARYQLHPRRVPLIEGATAVACGEAHALCLLRSGALLAWGQNSCGQVGCGPSSEGYLADAYRPVLLPAFGAAPTEGAEGAEEGAGRFLSPRGNAAYRAQGESWASAQPRPQLRMVTCGAFHSVAVDERGLAYSWGARGSPCLGHQDSPIVGEWNGRINQIFSISTTETKAMVPFELFEWCASWSMPRKIEMLAGGPVQSDNGSVMDLDDASANTSSAGFASSKQHVVQVEAGDLCTVFRSAEGRIFLCGSGPAVPNFMPASRLMFEEETEEEEQEREQEREDEHEAMQKLASVVAFPRCPSDSWLREICTRKAAAVYCSGNRIFSLLEEETASQQLTAPLLDNLLDKQPGSASVSASGSVTSEYSHKTHVSVFESRGKADCMLLASGKVFLCHKALLAQRSPELRNMIVMESPTAGEEQGPVQILLPELHRDAARALMHFLYRDVLPAWCIGSLSLLTSLSRTGKSLRMPRLQILCERFLMLLRDPSSAGKEGRSGGKMELDMPPPTLSRDLSSMVADPQFADVRFIAEGRAVVAHRFVLESRCAYFRAMFRSGMVEGGRYSGSGASGGMVDVVVPDTFVGFLRLLIFIYTGSLPDGSDGALLEDLMAADRYVVPDMKLLCENMLVPSESNWLDLLRAAQLLNSLRLELQVMAFLKVNFAVLQGLYHNDEGSQGEGVEGDESTVQYSNVADFQGEFPGLLEELLEGRKQLFPLPPSQLMIQRTRDSGSAADQETSKQEVPVFPLWALVGACVCFFFYQHVSRIIVLGPIIPVVNIAGFVLLAYFAFRFLF